MVQGVVFVLAGLLLQPLHRVVWLVLPLTVGGTAAIIVYSFWLRRRPAGLAR